MQSASFNNASDEASDPAELKRKEDGTWVIKPRDASIPTIEHKGHFQYCIIHHTYDEEGINSSNYTDVLKVHKDRPVSELYLPDTKQIPHMKWYRFLTGSKLLYIIGALLIIAPVFYFMFPTNLELRTPSFDLANTISLVLYVALLGQALWLMRLQRKLALFFRTSAQSIAQVLGLGAVVYLLSAVWIFFAYGGVLYPLGLLAISIAFAVLAMTNYRYFKDRAAYFYVPPLNPM